MTKELLSLSLIEISRLINQKQVSPVEIIEHTLKEIARMNPKINSFTIVDEENALKQAKLAEENIDDSKNNILHGVPIGVKDNIHTKGLTTTYGSPIYHDFVPEEDAFVVERLKDNGAIIVGKHLTHQFAYGPTGDRSHQGAARNPHHYNKMTGGSSGGSAASVSACLNYGAVGTDTGGSIRVPASFCGVVGMKPTFGRVSNRGVYPLVWSMDHVGPITRTVHDNAMMLNVVSEYDEKDYLSITRKREDFTRFIGLSIKHKVIGIPDSFFYDDVDDDIAKSASHIIELLRDSGVRIKYITMKNMDRYLESQRVIMRTEAYLHHKSNLKIHPTLWDEEVKERLLTGEGVSVDEYSKALRDKYFFSHELDSLFTEVDILLTPTSPILPLNVNERVVRAGNDRNHIRNWITKFTAPFNLVGHPSISIPSGFSRDSLPIGIQLIGRAYDEAVLYQIAYAIEQLQGNT